MLGAKLVKRGKRGGKFHDRGRIELIGFVEEGDRGGVAERFDVDSVLLPVPPFRRQAIDILIEGPWGTIPAQVEGFPVFFARRRFTG
jgi:hypothetical protein